MATPIPTYWIDALSGAPFGCNPALVCVLDRPALDVTCQALAREFKLSETVFVRALNEATRFDGSPQPKRSSSSGMRRLRQLAPS